MKVETLDSVVTPDLRRRRLLLGVPGGLLAASPFALVACGGGGDDASGTGTDSGSGSGGPSPEVAALAARLPALTYTSVAAKVVLPMGTGVAVASTNLVTPRNVSEVKSDGSAGIVTVQDAPQMAYVFDAAGRLLLMSVVETGVRTTVDSRGTAEALLLLSSEAALQNTAIGIAMRRALADPRFDSVVEPVRLAVEAAAGRNGIDPGDTALASAIKASTLMLRAAASTAPTRKPRRREALTVTPNDTQSGVTVLQTDDFNTIQLVNRYRRRTHVYVSNAGSYDAAGVLTPPLPPVAEADFALNTTTALSFDNIVAAVGDAVAEFFADLGFLGEYESGSVALQPVTSAPVTLPFTPAGAQAVKHTVRVIGLGGSHAGSLSDAENAAYDALLWETLIEDIAKPFARTLLIPFLSERAPDTLGPQFSQGTWQLVLTGFTDISSIAVGGEFFPMTLSALKSGEFKLAIGNFLSEFFSSNTFQALYERGFRAYMERVGQSFDVRGADGSLIGVNLVRDEELVARNVASLQAALGKLTRIIQAIKVGALIGDYAAIGHDLLSSDVATEFTVTATQAKVKLTPSPLLVDALTGVAGKGVITASITGVDASVSADSIFLEWKNTARYGSLFQTGGTGVDAFESPLTKPTQEYFPTGVEDNPDTPDTITVTAFYRNPTTAARFEMGRATVAVQFKREFNIVVSPASADVASDHDAFLTGLLKESLPDGATIVWTWSHGGVGSLGNVPPDANLQNSSVVFHAGSAEGAATATVSAVISLPAAGGRPARTFNVAPQTARLQVKRGIRTVTVTGSWTTDTFTFPNGSGGTGYSVIAFAVVPKVAGFSSCSVTLASADPYIPKQRYFGPNVFAGRDTDHGEQDRGGAIWLGLSGASGTIGNDGSGPAGARAYYAGRFADLVVTAVYTLAA